MSSDASPMPKRPRLDIAAAQQAAAASAQQKAANDSSAKDDAADESMNNNIPEMADLDDLGGFVMDRVLQEAAERKAIFVLGRFPDHDADAKAILILEKVAFSVDKVPQLCSKGTKVGAKICSTLFFLRFSNFA